VTPESDLRQLVSQVGDDDDTVSHAAEAALERAVSGRMVDDPEFIPNRDLTPEMIPLGTRDQHAVTRLAYTFNAYQVFGTSGPVLTFGNGAARRWKRQGKVPVTVTGLRTVLFIECRRRVHQAGDITEEGWIYTDALLVALRDALARGRPT
jgi:hypothetical protein